MSKRSVEIVEVAPRDGLQNECIPVATETKVELVQRLIDAGVRRMEVTSFINPKRVPQMADAEALLKSPSGKWVHAAKAWTKRMMEPSRIIASATCGRVS